MPKADNNQLPIKPGLLQALIDHAEHGFTISEREGNDSILLYVNMAFLKMTGYSENEVLYRDCRFLQRNDRKQHGVKRIHNAITLNESVRAVIRNYRKDGEMFWNDLTISPYFDIEDDIMYYIGVQKDITESVILERELQASYKHPS